MKLLPKFAMAMYVVLMAFLLWKFVPDPSTPSQSPVKPRPGLIVIRQEPNATPNTLLTEYKTRDNFAKFCAEASRQTRQYDHAILLCNCMWDHSSTMTLEQLHETLPMTVQNCEEQIQ